MQVHTVDVAVIGAGTAGLSAQRAARKAGKSALLIDRGPLGTTCARVGCMPSKLLIAAGEAAHAVTAAQLFGVYAAPPRIDGPAVLARVQRERDRFVSFVLADCEQLMARGELMMGEARVVAPGLLQVGEDVQVRFGALVVATGTVAQIPGAYAALPRELLLTNDSVFELKALPASVLVVGTGAIGLELGQALHRLGVRVTIVGNRGVVGPLQDTTVKAAALAALRRELDVQPSYQFEAIAAGGEGVTMRYLDDAGEPRSGTWERVLVAAGRRPALQGLGLEHAGVTFDHHGQPRGFTAETLRIAQTPVFLAGDVSGLRPLLHEASDEGHIAGENAARLPDGVEAKPRRCKLNVVFTEPQLVVVGDGCADDETFAHGEVDWGRQGRARVLGKNVGMTRVYATRADRVLRGAEMAGPGAEHMGHLVAWAVQQGLTVDRVLELPFYHPVLEEGLRTALRELRGALDR